MKVNKRTDGSQERLVLIGMIVDKTVLSTISSHWSPGMFSSRWGNLIGGWCIDYFSKYRRAPGKNIEQLFDEWAGDAKRDTETLQLVETFLSSLSKQYATLKRDTNPDYTLDVAKSYFNKVRLKELSESITTAIEDGDIEAADEAVGKFHKLQSISEPAVNLFSDQEAIRQAFEAKSEPLIEYEHGLGVFFGDALERDGFIAIQAPEKRGKTWMLLDMAWTASVQGRKVAFFEVGDMSRHQIIRRFMVRAARAPSKARTVRIPTTIVVEEGEKMASVEYTEKEFKKALDFERAWIACENLFKKGRMKGADDFRLSVHSNSSISVNGIRAILDGWATRDEWVPDVIVIDYADILAPQYGHLDSRDAINATWKGLRALSQEMHCLVITATQAKASSYVTDTMGKQDFSEDKRKMAHVTGMFGLNATKMEKDMGILRLNWIVLREEECSETICCHVATCLPLGNPTMLSVM